MGCDSPQYSSKICGCNDIIGYIQGSPLPFRPSEKRMVRTPGEACGFPSSCQNGDVLWGQADSAWEAIPMSYINTLVDSIAEAIGGGSGCTRRGD